MEKNRRYDDCKCDGSHIIIDKVRSKGNKTLDQ